MQRLGKRGLPAKAAKSKEHDEETINELKEAFKIFDSKNTGTSLTMQVRSMLENSRPS
jgi:Ca2+-binding EF-hand superfamily protein